MGDSKDLELFNYFVMRAESLDFRLGITMIDSWHFDAKIPDGGWFKIDLEDIRRHMRKFEAYFTI